MSKGYVAPRTPGANLVAACQNKEFNGCYIYVEGNSDVCFWKNFCSKTDTKIVACNGWTEVIDSVSMAKQKGKLSIGIVDRDFYDYIREAKKEEDQVFMTDNHDLEMMVYYSGDYEKVINNLDPGGKVQTYEENAHHTLLDEIKTIVDKIARYRIAVKKNHLNLKFKHQNKKHEIDFPDYEKILDNRFNYQSDEVLIKYIISWSTNKVSGAPTNYATVLPHFNAEDGIEYDEWSFLNGHDITLIMYILLKKKIKVDMKQTLSSDDLEHQLYIAYEKASLKTTDLYGSIKQYSDDNNVRIFNFD